MADSVPLYVNARFLTQEVTGVQRFAREISVQLREMWPGVTFLCPRDVKDVVLAKRLNIQVIGRSTGHKWEQWDLPRYLWRHGSPLLLNLTSTAPILYRNQVATLHDINFVRNPQSFSFQFRTFYRALVPFIMRRIHVLITVSEFSRKEISTYYRFPFDKICVVPNGVDTGTFRARPAGAGAEPEHKYLLAVSSNNYHKNFTRLVEAFLSLDAGDDLHLYVVGGSNASFSTATNAAVSRASNVRFLGRVDDAQLVDLYANAMAFVFPSLYEGFGIPPLEAQACGCPVLASSATSIPEVLGDSAVYFDPNSVEAIAVALKQILSEPALRLELIRRGRSNVSRYTWQSSARQVIEALRTASAP